MEKPTIQQKSRDFAIRIINCYKYLTEEKKEFVMSKQLLRCGTSIGANTRESKNAQSRTDFLSKLSIALNRRPSERRTKLAWVIPSEKEEDEVKEADETAYWLDLLQATDYLEKKMFDSLNDDCVELIKMLTAIIKTLKDK